jgi:hypothetical protein
MATIIEINIPDEYKNKNKYEIYSHLEKVSEYAHNLKQQIQDKDAEIKLRDAQLQKQRADILKLKSLVGHKNIEIHDLKLQSEIEDAEFTIVNKPNVPNFLPASVKFHEVKQELNK